jgi:hypothetical protein
MKRPNPDVRLPANRLSSLLFDWRADYALRSPTLLDAIRHVATFARSSIAYGVDTEGYLYPVVNHQWRTDRWQNASGLWEPYLLLEPQRTNDWLHSEDLSNAAWTKTGATVTTNATRAPDGKLTADKLAEDTSTGLHVAQQGLGTITDSTSQAVTFYAKAAERTFVHIRTTNKAGTVDTSWVNLSTGAAGTVDPSHTVRIAPMANGWYRVTVIWSSGTGATTPTVQVGPANGNGTNSYTGTSGSGIYLWGMQFEKNVAIATSYIKTTTAAVIRLADTLTWDFGALPQELTLYVDFIELGTAAINGTVVSIGADANETPRAMIYVTSGTFKPQHHNGSASVDGGAPSGTLSIGSRCEMVMTLAANGAVTLAWLPAGAGGVTTGTASSANAINTTGWGDPKVTARRHNGFTGEGCLGLRQVKIAAGSQGFAAMQTAF